MVSRSDVQMAYRLFLQREPETEAVVELYRKVRSVEDLCRIFLDCDEFRERFGRLRTPLEWPPIQVQVDVEAPVLAAMVAHVERTWSALGDVDPYWSVITMPQFRRDAFDAHAESFRDSGRIDVERLRIFAARAEIDLAQFRCCLELGCGVGRITRWLLPVFPSVVAADISRAHLSILATELPDSTVQPVLLANPDEILQLPEFDVFLSLIVLQHNPPPVMALMLRNALTRLGRGGIGYFQVPTYSKGYGFDAEAYMRDLSSGGGMEMHVLPQAEVFAIVQACGCNVLEVREDGYTGDTGVSNTFFVRKRDF